MTVKAVAFVAKSGTGKTTLVERVIPRLKERGYKVGAVKHDAHRFDIDHPGKDSYRFTAAGADLMVISSSEKTALVERNTTSPPVEDLLSRFFGGMDIVLVEGFKKSALPKIEVHRKAWSGSLLCRGAENDPMLLAVASDGPLEVDVPVLDVNDPETVAAFIEEKFLK
jgi:molybdopterin-guanine dinucleotide biosynthesis protein MobB